LPVLAGDPRCRVVAGADPLLSRREAFAARYGAETVPDSAALVSRDDVDAVFIASPTYLHAEHAIQAARAGKHVLLEKPIAANAADAREIVAAVDRERLVLVVGHTHAFDPPIRAIRDLVRSGTYGALIAIVSNVATDWVYRMRRPDEQDRARGGGVVFNQGAHHVEIARAIADDEVVRVNATVGAADPARGDGHYLALLHFARGATASLTYTGYDRFSSLELTGLGERGEPATPTLGATRRRSRSFTAEEEARARDAGEPKHFEETSGQACFGVTLVCCERADIRQSEHGLYIYDDDGRKEVTLPARSTREAVVNEFLEAVNGQARPLHDGRWATKTLDVLLAVLESSRVGTDVKVGVG
jgi:phthalate 4,5-cis-dihydrodiol dehydrogenase